MLHIAAEAYFKNILRIFSPLPSNSMPPMLPSMLTSNGNVAVDFYLVSSAVIIRVIFDNSTAALPGYTGIKW